MTTFKFTTSVEAETQEQANQVMAERLDVDEDYGFPYTLSWASTTVEEDLLRPLVSEMADVLNGIDTDGTWETMNCTEVESIAAVLRAIDRGDVADGIIALHAEEDDEGDRHHADYVDAETFTAKDAARLALLENDFRAAGGRGVSLAEEIDELHAKRDANR